MSTDNNQVNLHVRLLHTTATLSYYKHVLETEYVLCTDNTQVNIHVRYYARRLHYLTIKHVLETENVLCTENTQVNLHVRLLHTTATLSYYKT